MPDDVRSLSARRAWIEIFVTIIPSNFSNVALRKESVDRNDLTKWFSNYGRVALRKESVDRNMPRENLINSICLSLSARRAWIEMDFSGTAWVQEFRRSPQGERG